MGRRRKKGDLISGWINLNKPYGMTSTQAIGKVRRILNAQKIGHAGTLDPLATGILPIALGEATKTIQYIQDDLKTYRFSVTWGEQRSTDDMEGDVIGKTDIRPEPQAIKSILNNYLGEIEQVPPRFSAIKINGERAYDIARDGEEPDLKSRIVYIEDLKLLDARESEADFEMICGKGTYVRSLARDMGIALGSLGYVSHLRRTKVGNFTESNSISLDKLEELDYVAARSEYLLPLQDMLDDIPALILKEEETAKIRNGQSLQFISKPDYQRLVDIGLENSAGLALAMCNDLPVAIIEQDKALIKPVRVFNL